MVGKRWLEPWQVMIFIKVISKILLRPFVTKLSLQRKRCRKSREHKNLPIILTSKKLRALAKTNDKNSIENKKETLVTKMGVIIEKT
jgi:hypothetical protein